VIEGLSTGTGVNDLRQSEDGNTAIYEQQRDSVGYLILVRRQNAARWKEGSPSSHLVRHACTLLIAFSIQDWLAERCRRGMETVPM